jgi:hypothetical protein
MLQRSSDTFSISIDNGFFLFGGKQIKLGRNLNAVVNRVDDLVDTAGSNVVFVADFTHRNLAEQTGYFEITFRVFEKETLRDVNVVAADGSHDRVRAFQPEVYGAAIFDAVSHELITDKFSNNLHYFG